MRAVVFRRVVLVAILVGVIGVLAAFRQDLANALPMQESAAADSALAVDAPVQAQPASAMAARSQAPHPAEALPQANGPDALLISVYRSLGSNDLRAALQNADALVASYPNFQLGHLIRGDLLLMQTRPVKTLGAVQGVTDDRLENLRHEAQARIRALRERPDARMVPDALVQLRPDQRFAFVVDARRSRLYVYENRDGYPQLVTDYYVSQGKSGVNKLREGDQKTPLGVYYITSRLQGPKLPDFYGSGALPISYPNEWDRLHGRGGSGIWLHGTPSDSFSRPPLSSDGCVVLANPDLTRLSETAEIGRTPVVIADEVRFVSHAQLDRNRTLAGTLTENWRRDLEAGDGQRLRTHYSRSFRTEQGTLDNWLDRQQKWMATARNGTLSVRDVSYFMYPGAGDLLVATFTQDAGQNGKQLLSQRMRQYWAREGSHWRIVAETAWQQAG